MHHRFRTGIVCLLVSMIGLPVVASDAYYGLPPPGMYYDPILDQAWYYDGGAKLPYPSIGSGVVGRVDFFEAPAVGYDSMPCVGTVVCVTAYATMGGFPTTSFDVWAEPGHILLRSGPLPTAAALPPIHYDAATVPLDCPPGVYMYGAILRYSPVNQWVTIRYDDYWC